MKRINEKEFKTEVLESEIPTVVLFWAPWCGPCRYITPTLEELAEEHNHMKFVIINVDEHIEMARNYNVDAIPALLFFNRGKEVDRLIGLADKAKIQSRLQSLTGNP